ncbi:unnamed protein product [Linum trigynum]|uniref:Uncharacterized protein n=1 Tax=Linum trigynum TaxID=586398 RepID=A0AAV2F425_9ROSI
MTRKVVVRVPNMNKNPKCRTRALTIAVSVARVESVTIMEEKNEIAVTGEGIDAVTLACLLRKKVGFADVLSVADVKPDKKNEPSRDGSGALATTNNVPAIGWRDGANYNCYYNYVYGHPHNCPYHHPY